MNRTMWGKGVVIGLSALVAIVMFLPVDAEGQSRRDRTQERQQRAERNRDGGEDREPRDVSMNGRLVDIHSWMLDEFEGDEAKDIIRRSIRTGVPVGIDTPAGFVLLGREEERGMADIANFAGEVVQVSGKLMMKKGTRYLLIDKIQKDEEAARPSPARRMQQDDPEQVEEEDLPEVEEPEEPQAEPEDENLTAALLNEPC